VSGGSWGYFSFKLEEVADRLIDSRPTTSQYLLRRALGKHLKKCATALHEIEWVDSCDTSPGGEKEALKACFENAVQSIEADEILSELKRLESEIIKLKDTNG
jgi:hypothetical protein